MSASLVLICRSPVISGIKILRIYPRAKLWNVLPSPATRQSILFLSLHLAPCHNQFLWHCAPTLHISYYISVWFICALIAWTSGLGHWAGVRFLFPMEYTQCSRVIIKAIYTIPLSFSLLSSIEGLIFVIWNSSVLLGSVCSAWWLLGCPLCCFRCH